jgi:hypothetical protein
MKNKLTCSLLFAFPLFIHTCKDPKLAPCFDIKQISQKWKNEYIQMQGYNAKNSNEGSYRIYPTGIFKLNSDSTYNVMSDDVPLNGKWMVNSDCSITLDQNSSNKRTFAIVKLTQDSLVISRKDESTLTIYTQHYSAN